MSGLSWEQKMVLRHIADAPQGKTMGRPRRVDIRNVSEAYRQRVIDLGMMQPPLVDIDGDWLSVTDAGRSALRSLEGRDE